MKSGWRSNCPRVLVLTTGATQPSRRCRRLACPPDGTIRAQVGHVSAQVAKRYSHIRRQELNRAAAAHEPKFLKSVLVITPENSDSATIN